jgi:hypothetical protein
MTRSIFAAGHVGRAFAALAIASHFALPQQVAANRTATAGSLDGIVTDTSLVPLANAIASIVGRGIQVVTASNGRFRIVDLPAGRHHLLVRRVGFEPLSTELTIAPGDTLRASFALVRIGTNLDTVVVRGTRLSSKLQEFEQRRKLGEGQFMTAEDIDKLHVVGMDDVLYHLISNRVRPAASGAGVGTPCFHAQWYLDGVLLPPTTTPGDLGPPSAMAGIEYYSGPTTIPVQYKSTSGAGFCGVVLMWTKDGSERP